MADGGASAAIDFSLHPKQTIAFQSQATEILFGGAAGPGKSHLLRVVAIVWCASIANLQVYLFRREFPDLYKNHMEGPTGFPAMLAPWVLSGLAKINYSKNFIELWNGAKIHLCHCQHEKNKYDYQGAEMHVLMIDELTHFTESIYRYLRGRVRLGGLAAPPAFVGRLPRVICGSNPGGLGHNWVKASWVDLLAPLELRQMPPAEGGLVRQYIPARLTDNPTMSANDPEYASRLAGLGDTALIKAMLEGDWNIVSGGALDDVWSPRIIVPRFHVPASWRVDRSFDWGSSHPFSALWWAQADGTEATLPDGTRWAPPRGSLVLLHEWYGAKGANEGLKISPRDVAAGILERERDLVAGRWVAAAPKPGPADNSISAVSQPGTPTIADEMATAGVRWTASDKAPGTRKIGLELIRSRLREAGKERPEAPALFVMEHCRSALAHWPVLPRDSRNPDDVDSDAEDHDYDALRYRVLATARSATVTPLRI
jgi:hypothetical protein